MFVLDTNVVSELRKARSGSANARVVAWAAQSPPGRFYLSAITILELEIGVLSVLRRDPAQGKLMRAWLADQVLRTFESRVLPVDAAVAQRCATLHVPDRKPERDALIAATALVHGMTVATRNVADFQRTGVELVNPWQQAGT